MLKVAVLSLLASVAFADHPLPHPHPAHPVHPVHPHPVGYKPAPYAAPPHPPAYKAHPAPYAEKHEPPQPFTYQYGVNDAYAGTNFDKSESQDAYGNLEGSYRVALPDGRVQVVTYKADHEHGFIADVSYEGKAVYPDPPQGGYPTYHAAPPKYPVHPPPPQPKYPAPHA